MIVDMQGILGIINIQGFEYLMIIMKREEIGRLHAGYVDSKMPIYIINEIDLLPMEKNTVEVSSIAPFLNVVAQRGP